ncbi:uncharacterized protein LOC106647071 isoform X1 [Copidosoma floridanum]|uniref:uncharacterized protein LOC106647071 isoform X1 n=1 Tax=Copidosoma floridanum TaxID=29053 RepID=UPI0006C9B8B6|nr:uncharacterized protein LOC106647071 isoform X1 [Copidosoma floridanum]
MWGTCDNGTEAVGCGNSEMFKNCADVNIVTSVAGLPPIFAQQLSNPFLLYYRDYASPSNASPLIIRSQVCVPNSSYQRILGMDKWCQTNCLRYPPNCPSSICTCLTDCQPQGEIAGRKGAIAYCLDQCLVYLSKCPANKCHCF